MTDSKRCPQCGSPLPQDGALDGGCPRCMLELGFESSVGTARRSEPGTRPEQLAIIGRYRILRLIGEGGMGGVYEAEQEHPRRTVALKIIKAGMASSELLRRFEQESQALGRLQHPGIAQIYEAGTVDTGFGTQPYFAMELIHGQSPREYAEANHLKVRDRLNLMVKICDAVHHAHQRGLIHRELKPGNILVDETGQPKILDFGVARVTDSDTRVTLQTDMGQLIGTLAYMSPEQALADPLDIDTRSDVYSMGVILYELLSGRLPYTLSKKVHEAIQAIREEAPARLSTSNRTLLGDIETIVAKALEKERDRRYASAAEMAADIQRYLNDDPIVARRPSASYQLQKFARRNKALVSGVAAVFIVLVAGVVAVSWYATEVAQQRDRLEKAERMATDSAQKANEAGFGEAEQHRSAVLALSLAEKQTRIARRALSANEANQYFNNIVFADQERVASNIGRADQLLNEVSVSLHNWEWNYLSRLNHMEDAVLRGHRDAVSAMALDANGRLLRTVDASGTFKDWDLGAYKQTATGTFGGTHYREFAGLGLSNDGRLLYSSHAWTTTGVFSAIQEFWDLFTGKVVFSLRAESPDFAFLEARATLFGPVAMSPDGKRVVAGFRSSEFGTTRSTLRTWDIDAGLEGSPLNSYTGLIGAFTFSPNGDKLALVLVSPTDSPRSSITNLNTSITILNGTSGQELIGLANARGNISAMAFSSDSATIAAGIDGEGIRVWNAADGKVRWSISSGNVNRIAFSPDSRLIAVAMDDRTIRILDGATGQGVDWLTGHTGGIYSLRFTPDSKRLLSAGADKLIRIWNMRSLIPGRILDVGRIESPLQISPDARTLLTSTGYGLKSWDLNTAMLEFESSFVETGRNMSFSKDGKRIVSVNKTDGRFNVLERGDLQVLDADTGRLIALLHPPTEETRVTSITRSFQLSSSGNRAALILSILPAPGIVARQEGYGWDLPTGRLTTRYAIDPDLGPASFQFSPDGKLATLSARIVEGGVSMRAAIDIYDTTTGRRRHRLFSNSIARSTFSPDGKRLLVVEGARSMTVWDVQTGLKLVSFPEAGNTGITLLSTDFSPNGTRLVSTSSDGEVRLWDAESGKALIRLQESSGPYEVREVTIIAEKYGFRDDPKQVSIAFSPDGRKITRTTVMPDPKGARIRIETWDGSPLQK